MCGRGDHDVSPRLAPSHTGMGGGGAVVQQFVILILSPRQSLVI